MSKYRCSICGYIHDENNDGDFSKVVSCPICRHVAGVFEILGADGKPIKKQSEPEPKQGQASGGLSAELEAEVEAMLDEITSEADEDGFMELVAPVDDEYGSNGESLDYPSEFVKYYGDERYMDTIHKISVSGESEVSSMATQLKLPSWDDIRILPASICPSPLSKDAEVNTTTVIGKEALQPMELDTPVIISHMSYGALSEEAKVALSKGSAMAGSAIGSGDGGVLSEEMENAGKYILEYTPDLFSVTDYNLKKADAVEIKLSQSARAGLGAYLPAVKVSSDIAEMRGCTEGVDFVGKSSFDNVATKEELKSLVNDLRERSDGRPIGIKLAAGRLERDLENVTYAEPDFITIDGAEGACGTVNSVVRDSLGVPTIYALYRAKKFLKAKGLDDKIALIITGGLRSSADFAKAIAMGADAVAVGTAALMSLACQQYRMCESGQCPMGLATQDPVLRSRLQKDVGSQRVANYLNVSLDEIKSFARITGKDDVHKLSVGDLATVSSDIAENTDIEHI